MSESKPYFYETEIEWKGEKDLRINSGKLPAIEAGAPPEFKGQEGNWSPEHLFVASLNSCYTLTLLPSRNSRKFLWLVFLQRQRESSRKFRGAAATK
jgi:organic hydroperoxide reductase OsmC/OhrA